MKFNSVLLLVLLVALCSCGEAADGEISQNDSVQDCKSFVHEYATMHDRCIIGSYADAAVHADSVIVGSCENVIAVRDREQLRMQCLPSMATEACSYVTSPDYELDSTCKGQFYVNKD